MKKFFILFALSILFKFSISQIVVTNIRYFEYSSTMDSVYVVCAVTENNTSYDEKFFINNNLIKTETDYFIKIVKNYTKMDSIVNCCYQNTLYSGDNTERLLVVDVLRKRLPIKKNDMTKQESDSIDLLGLKIKTIIESR